MIMYRTVSAVVRALVLPSPENMGSAGGISLLSYTQAEIKYIVYVLPVRAAMFDLPVTRILESIRTSLIVLLDSEMSGKPLESRCYLIYKQLYTTKPMYFR